jgi:hypothetical protein
MRATGVGMVLVQVHDAESLLYAKPSWIQCERATLAETEDK